jgi:homoserine dehydrogenase
MRHVKIGLLGCGTVGSGVARLLRENGDLIRSRLGAEIVLARAADINPRAGEALDLPAGVFTTDAAAVVDDPQVEIVVEMIGGQGVARDLILRAIAAGKPVVTANKALLAAQGTALFRAAAQRGVDLAFEASVGGCMPVIKTLRESLAGNRIRAMVGILNGTCNYILSQITHDGRPFREALAEAQRKGYAEADPTLDVEGHDTAHKLAILSGLAYGMEIDLASIYIEGIARITPMDIAMAGEFGYRIKLLAIGKRRGEAIEARVHPTMIPFDNLLSNVDGTLNALTISGDAVGEIVHIGHGAGMMPTASAVLSDLVDIARNLLSAAPVRVPLLSFQPGCVRPIPILPIAEVSTHYYIRFSALDQPGVLSRISGVLGRHGISLKSVHQKGRKTNGSVPLVMLTHLAREADVQQALAEIAALDVVSDRPILIRIEDDALED